MNKKSKVFFGEMHDNTHQVFNPDFNMDKVLELAKSHLDFYAAAYYPSTSKAFQGGGHPSDENGALPLNIEEWKDDKTIESEWTQSCQSVSQYNKTGEFVTFPGYEWQGDARGGDHNVFFNFDYPPFFKCDTLKELYKVLDEQNNLAIPHHTAYIPGFRGKDWALINSKISPFSEVFSVHGSSEGDMWGGGLIDNSFLAPDITDSSYSSALKKGLILGAIGSTDNWGNFPGHYGHGLAAVIAEDLSRDSIWKALKERHVYALTGDRILLDFKVNDSQMGSVIPLSKEAQIDIDVEAQDAIEYIELLKNEETLKMFFPKKEKVSSNEFKEYKLRFEFGWGPSSSYAKMDPKEWNGTISVSEGYINDVSPLLVDGEHKYQKIDKNKEEKLVKNNLKKFNFNSVVNQVEADYPHHNSFLLTLNLKEDSLIKFDINGQEQEFSCKQLLEGSQAFFYTDEAREMLKNEYDVKVESLYRNDVIYGMSYKYKIHKMLQKDQYQTHISVKDEIDSSCFYRVRVKQRNGQMALSSPIWLNNNK